VRRIQRVAHFDGQREHRLAVHRLGANRVLQRLAVGKLHSDKRLLAAFADSVDGADDGLAEHAGDNPTFASPHPTEA
jgi:hypothetical protein